VQEWRTENVLQQCTEDWLLDSAFKAEPRTPQKSHANAAIAAQMRYFGEDY